MQTTTVLAHSMGGVVTHRLIAAPSEVFWNAAFSKPLSDLSASEAVRQTLGKAFKSLPELHVKRVISMAVPHRGSHYADKFIDQLGAWFHPATQCFHNILRSHFSQQSQRLHKSLRRAWQR